MAYVDTYTRSMADEFMSHDMLAKNNQFLTKLLEWGNGGRTPSRGSQINANVYYKEKTPQVVNQDTTYNKTEQEPIATATYQYAQVQNSVYLGQFDHQLNTGQRFDDMNLSNGMANLPVGDASTLINVNREQVINEYANFWRTLNADLIAGQAVAASRTGYASKILGLADFADPSGTSFAGLTRATIGNHSYDGPTSGTKQGRWSPVVTTGDSNVLRLYGNAANSLARHFAVLNKGTSQLSGQAAVNSEYHSFISQGTFNMMTDALKGQFSRNIAPGGGAGANANVPGVDRSYFDAVYNTRFHVDSDIADGLIYTVNRANVWLAQQRPTRTMSAGNIMGAWRLQQDIDKLLLPMNKQVQLCCDDLSQVGICKTFTSITL